MDHNPLIACTFESDAQSLPDMVPYLWKQLWVMFKDSCSFACGQSDSKYMDSLWKSEYMTSSFKRKFQSQDKKPLMNNSLALTHGINT